MTLHTTLLRAAGLMLQKCALHKSEPHKKVNFTLLAMLLLLPSLLPLSPVVHSVELNEKAKSFRAKGYNTDNFRLAEHRGKVVVLHFWATWCASCRQAVAELGSLRRSVIDNPNITVISINIDTDYVALDSFINDLKLDLPILTDVNLSISKLYNISTMPSTVIIDKEGILKDLIQDYESGSFLQYKDSLIKHSNEF